MKNIFYAFRAIFYLLGFFIIAQAGPLLGESQGLNFFQGFINFGIENRSSGFIEVKGFENSYPIYKFQLWAKKQGLKAGLDNPPIINNYLRILSPGGARIYLTKLNHFKSYFLWIDFISLKKMDRLLSMNTQLKIYLNGKLNKTLQVSHKKMFKSPVKILLNELFINRGSVTIDLISAEGHSSFWGVFDIYLTVN